MLLQRAAAAFQKDLSLAFVLILEDDAMITAALEKQAGGFAALRQALGSASRTPSVCCGYTVRSRGPYGVPTLLQFREAVAAAY